MTFIEYAVIFLACFFLILVAGRIIAHCIEVADSNAYQAEQDKEALLANPEIDAWRKSGGI